MVAAQINRGENMIRMGLVVVVWSRSQWQSQNRESYAYIEQ
jgi:hypothetical protein